MRRPRSADRNATTSTSGLFVLPCNVVFNATRSISPTPLRMNGAGTTMGGAGAGAVCAMMATSATSEGQVRLSRSKVMQSIAATSTWGDVATALTDSLCDPVTVISGWKNIRVKPLSGLGLLSPPAASNASFNDTDPENEFK